MFREASAIDSERTAATVRSLYAKYTADENWFTGTPDSVDRRIAQAKRIANAAKAACVRLSGRNVVSQYIALAHEMDTDRKALEGLRRDLLTAASDRDEVSSVDELIGPPYAEDYQDKFEEREDEEIPPGLRELLGFWGKKKHDDKDDGDEGADDVRERHERPLPPHLMSQPAASFPMFIASRAEARHFVASQECDDLRELMIRAKHYAERVSSTQPPQQSAVFVRSFVEAVRDAYEPPRQRRTAATHSIQNYPSELMYFDDIE